VKGNWRCYGVLDQVAMMRRARGAAHWRLTARWPVGLQPDGNGGGSGALLDDDPRRRLGGEPQERMQHLVVADEAERWLLAQRGENERR
jgi:hypothetical protein